MTSALTPSLPGSPLGFAMVSSRVWTRLVALVALLSIWVAKALSPSLSGQPHLNLSYSRVQQRRDRRGPGLCREGTCSFGTVVWVEVSGESFGLVSCAGWASLHLTFPKARSPPPALPAARNSDPKLTWSPGPVANTSLAHELWKVPLPPKSITAPSRPPPGLTGQKPPLSAWDPSPLRVGGGWGSADARYTPGEAKHGAALRGRSTGCWRGLARSRLSLPVFPVSPKNGHPEPTSSSGQEL